MMMGRTQDAVTAAGEGRAAASASSLRLWSAPLLIAALLAMAGCATTPDQRTPWHQYLHDHGLE